ncbi:MAG TPA: DUF2950 domain-containing protein [Myxococcota bacterium]|nr:DUF2950 domain-containing protein [Myxococcota bacterium]
MTHSMVKRLAILVSAAFVAIAAGKTLPPEKFASPEAAADALAAAAKAGDSQSLLAIFGSSAAHLIDSGDPVADKNVRDDFAQAYDTKHSLEHPDGSKAVLVYGDDDFPFPVPIVKQGEQWAFDTEAGKHEILARRVGRNELAAIQVCLAFVDAEREYASVDRDGDGLLEYADKLISSPGKQDGLYWPTEPGQPESPMGELVAEARSEGYSPKQGERAPYHGYLYKLLTKQGKHAAGGAFDYMVRKRMIGGFALVAYPAEYANSGIMTFIVNYDDVVYSKDLGPDTAKIASAMTAFDPDDTWKKEQEIDAGGQ